MASAPPLVPAAHERLNPIDTSTLSSNNPFRRASPISADAVTTPVADNVNTAATANNPFLDDYSLQTNGSSQPQLSSSPTKPLPPAVDRPQRKPTGDDPPTKLMAGMTLNEQSASNRNIVPRSRPLPPPQNGGMPPKHRTTRSQEEDNQARKDLPSGRSHPRPIDAVLSPRRRENTRPRRNSESSVMESDEERKRRERRLKEREARHKDKDGKPRDPHSKPRRPNRRIDLIDRLDVTGIYGGGFHHDGPFDACAPQRNRKGMKTAPMQAFPEKSANMTLGGAGPINKGLDFDRIHGIGAEGFSDYNTTTVDPFDAQRRALLARQYILNPREKADQVHGEESAGLGTSTFLEGAPASRVSMQRRENEAGADLNANGLQRKKSIVQKFRGISRPRQNSNELGRVITAETRPLPASMEPPMSAGIQSAPIGQSSPSGRGNLSEINPFFAEVEYKDANIKEDEQNTVTRARAPSSPSRGLLRRTTTQDSVEAPEQKAGLMSRVKSLKGGKRTKTEKRVPEVQE